MTKKILLFSILVFFSFKMTGQNTIQELLDIKDQLITHAIEVGKEYDLNLDFSDASIKSVEFILSDLHKEFIKTKSDYGLNGLAHIFGFYIIEVIEKNHGKGRIERNHPSFVEDVFPFYWNGATLFPVAWCQKRIFDGDADNVAFKYKMLILDKKGNE